MSLGGKGSARTWVDVLNLISYLTLAAESSKQENYNTSACETSCEKQKGVDLSTPHFRCLNEAPMSGAKLSWALPQRETWRILRRDKLLSVGTFPFHDYRRHRELRCSPPHWLQRGSRVAEVLPEGKILVLVWELS